MDPSDLEAVTSNEKVVEAVQKEVDAANEQMARVEQIKKFKILPTEWEPGGEYVTKQLDRIWTKYTGKPGPYALRDPKIDEKRVLFVCGIDRIATFGEP